MNYIIKIVKVLFATAIAAFAVYGVIVEIDARVNYKEVTANVIECYDIVTKESMLEKTSGRSYSSYRKLLLEYDGEEYLVFSKTVRTYSGLARLNESKDYRELVALEKQQTLTAFYKKADNSLTLVGYSTGLLVMYSVMAIFFVPFAVFEIKYEFFDKRRK